MLRHRELKLVKDCRRHRCRIAYSPRSFLVKNHRLCWLSRLKTVYQHPSDIELFPGGLSETPTESGKLGPTFACVVAKQFQDLKFGDRYWTIHKLHTTNVGTKLKTKG